MAEEKVSKAETVSGQFQASAAEIDTIFDSYRELHTIYAASFGQLEIGLNDLPVMYKKKVENAKKVFENVKSTVDGKQIEISDQLYAQGLVLLVGAAESITKEMFHNLLVCNIRKITLKDKLNLPVNDVLKAKTDKELAELVFGALANESNPAEKLNFQNMQQLKGIMSGYLKINLEDSLMVELHEYWQIRHIIIHNASIIDQQFLDNLTKAKIPIKKYVIGEKIKVMKEDYDKCSSLLILLFDAFDSEIDRLKLDYVSG